jgi:hypothetical protein
LTSDGNEGEGLNSIRKEKSGGRSIKAVMEVLRFITI